MTTTTTTNADAATASQPTHQTPLVSTAITPEKTKQTTLFSTVFSPQISTYFIAGGVAGATSRTVVSPLERIKIIQSVFSLRVWSRDQRFDDDPHDPSSALTDRCNLLQGARNSTGASGAVSRGYGVKKALLDTCGGTESTACESCHTVLFSLLPTSSSRRCGYHQSV